MMRTWTLRGFVALLALSVAAPALRAGPESPTTDDKLTQVLIQLQEVKSKLYTIQANQDLQIKSMQDDIDHLKDDMRRLTEDVRRLSAATTNISASINPNPPPVVAPVTGTILLENRYSFPATVVVNGQSLRLNPFEKRNVVAPVGRFTYAVYTDNYGLVQAQADRYLAPGRDYPITINP